VRLAACLVLVACGPGTEGTFRGGSGSWGQQGDDGLNVVQQTTPGAWPDCEDGQGCWEDYLELPELLAHCARPTTEEALLQQFQDVDDHVVPVYEEELHPSRLKQQLVDALNNGCLLDGMDERLLTVSVLEREEAESYERFDLLFEDPLVGRFTGILIQPWGDPPSEDGFPAVVGIHGHRGYAEDFLTTYNGQLFPGRGYTMLMLDMRADRADEIENDVSWALLLEGFTLIGMRGYETMLANKYLRWLDNVDESAIGLMGHSGGSSASNVTIRVDWSYSAYASDWVQEYWNDGCGATTYQCIMDEMAPSLHPYHELVNDFETSEAPILAVEYDSATTDDGIQAILDFFDEALL